MIGFELIRADRIINEILEQRFLSCRQRMKYENDIKSSQTGLLVHSTTADDAIRVQYAFHGNHLLISCICDWFLSFYVYILVLKHFSFCLNRCSSKSNTINSSKWSIEGVTSIKSIMFN
jgi:hypothetical protein